VNRSAALANRQAQIDVATFTEWVDARASHRTELADFYRTRFRDEFRPAFAAWIATRPFDNRDAPRTPFAMPQYRLAATQDAELGDAAAGHRCRRLARQQPRVRAALLVDGQRRPDRTLAARASGRLRLYPAHEPRTGAPGWRPVFLDYLHRGFTNATAFSPTDVMPLTHRAKFTMLVQSTVALALFGLIVARAVNAFA
jgi:hypothetical protein